MPILDGKARLSTDMPDAIKYFLADRVEVIDSRGRAFTAHDVKDVMTVLQDNGKTLKIFLKNED